ncbi:MAG: glycosyltransferase [Bacteroidota bacterium]
MKFLLLSIGTRGDMEPLLAIGDILQQAGHEVRCVMPAQFEELVADTDLEFRPLDRAFLELLDTAEGQAIMGQKGGWWSRIRQYIRLARQSIKLQNKLIAEQRDYLLEFEPDRVVYHPKALYGRMFGMRYPGRAFAISPIANWLHPVEAYSHVAINKNLGRRGNLWTYRAINWVTARVTVRMGKAFREDLGTKPFTGRAVYRHMRDHEQVFYMVSRSLFPRPENWPDRAKVMGYLERVKTNNWSPSNDLIEFLEKHRDQKILFFTFGSMVNSGPEAITKSIINSVSELGAAAILNTFSGGLARPDHLPDHIFVVDSIPYEWIFPKIYAVVHHGGAGTTHTALKHACASLVIPHIIDQFFWNKRCADLGVGPAGIPIKRVNEKTLTPLLEVLLQNPSYKQAARQVAEDMKIEGDVGRQMLEALTGP